MATTSARPTAEEPFKASLQDTQNALNAAASKSGFRCVPVSWEDAQRGTVGGALSCWGGNISDVRLWAKDGTLLYTLRTENWNERLGYVASKDVAVVVGNHVPGGEPFAPITLQRYLKDFKKYAKYAGNESEQLWDEKADQLLSVRFQAVFLPIATEETCEFCTEVYNYNTHSDDDPRNTILLCTAQGTNVQQDGSGAKKVFIHNVDRDNKVHRYWLEAERSKHKVGGAQLETDEEAAAAAARGKATAIHIGTKEMGTRFNVQMLIQLPVQQKKKAPQRNFGGPLLGGGGGVGTGICYASGAPGICYSSAALPKMSAEPKMAPMEEEDEDDGAMGCDLFGEDELEGGLISNDNDDTYAAEELASPPPPPPMPSAEAECSKKSKVCSRRAAPVPPKPVRTGTANAARVSRGTEHDVWKGINHKSPVRDPSQHGTITVTLYYTVAGGVPSTADVEACVADLDALYKACPSDKKLVDCGEVTAELTVKNMQDIEKKVTTQAYVPPSFAPVKSTFPVDSD